MDAQEPPTPSYPPFRLAGSPTDSLTASGPAVDRQKATPGSAEDIDRALGHWADDDPHDSAARGAAAKQSSATSKAQESSDKSAEPADDKHPLDTVDVHTRTERVMELAPAEIFARVTWNTQPKAHAYRTVMKAASGLRNAEAALRSASGPQAKEKAHQQVEAAQKNLEDATAKLRNFVLSELPRIERNDEQMQQLRSSKARVKAALAKTKNPEEKEELAAWRDALQADEKSRHNELREEIEKANYNRVSQDRYHHRIEVDGQTVSLNDHVNAYATMYAHGLDGKADKEQRGGSGRNTVEQVLKTAPFSDSIKNIIKQISASEGGFSTVNTYDRAVLTWGMLQWTGGHKGDLEDALRIIKRVAPEAFAERFIKYGIDVQGQDLVVKSPDGHRFEGEAAAKAVLDSPALTAVMARAGTDPAIQVGEVTAAVETKIDRPLSRNLNFRHKGKNVHVRIGDIFTSEYAVGVLADASVHAGLGSVMGAMEHQLQGFLESHGYDPADVAKWAPAAEKALIPAVIAGWTDRASELAKHGCSKSAGSFKR